MEKIRKHSDLKVYQLFLGRHILSSPRPLVLSSSRPLVPSSPRPLALSSPRPLVPSFPSKDDRDSVKKRMSEKNSWIK